MANETKTANIQVTPREIDFVTRFGNNWDHLREILGITRPIKKVNGAVLRSKKARITLQSGSVNEAATIPFSEAFVDEVPYAEMSVEKYAKSVTLEAIKDHGYEAAVGMTDDAFLFELQNRVTGKFYTYLKTGELTNIQTTFKAALAMAKGLVVNKFKAMHRNVTNVVGFVNVLDVYEWLAGQNTYNVESKFGFEYLKNFMGYSTIFLCADGEIPQGTVIATPVENIVNYYVDPSDSDFARAGLSYAVDGITNMIGFHTVGNYSNATSEAYAILGLVLFAEYIDGIAVVKIEASGSLGSITLTSAAGTATGDSKVKATYTAGAGETLWVKDLGATAAPAYKDIVDLTGWAAIKANTDTNIEDLTSGNTLTCIAVNGSGQAVAKGTATIVVKA